ncbi:MAG TPA: YfhO family protein [Bacteroidales bacterium]|nr:YfhO family protein [Bacteroidales bacterium]HPP93079.1 YfhO family protein [Bacteroidales bacterium]HRR16258.1 YfhO family protein [Bacteroidales bacterium]HRT47621.1 YfhO family protein [Bacteroidales bacterium]HRU56831.1 YfhO family protein [Bacteroidales bacterium]
MQNPINIKATLPHAVAIILFAVVSLVYFYPVIEGKVLVTNDGTVAYNSASEIRNFREKYGQEPLWTNSMFGGMPAYLISVKYYGNLMRYVDQFLKFMKLPVAPVFLTMTGFYILLLFFKVDYRLAIAGAIAYGFSSYFIIILGAGHNTKAFAIAYMAPVIGSVYYSYKKDLIKGSLLLAFFLTLQILSNHPQILYYTLLCILVFIIAEFITAIRTKEVIPFLKKSLVLIISVLLSAGMNFASLYTTYEYGKYSIRGKSDLIIPGQREVKGLNKDYATQWSYGIDETLTMLIPNFKGGANRPFDTGSATAKALRLNNASQYAANFHRYWGSQPWTDGPVYVGAIVVFLFIMGLILIKGPIKWWLAIATLLSVMLSWGKNFMPLTDLFFYYFPGYNKFRAVTMILVIAEFCMPLLAILTLKEIFEKRISQKDFLKALKISLGITGGLTLLFLLFPGLAGSFLSPGERESQLPGWLTEALKKDRIELLRADAFRSLIFILLSASVLLGFIFKKLKVQHCVAILGLLFLLDMFPVDKRHLNAGKFTTKSSALRFTLPSAASQHILKDTTIFRVLNLTVSPFNDASTSLFHHSIGGYHGAKLKRYNELIDSVLYPEIVNFTNMLQQPNPYPHIDSALQKLHGLNMLNTKYFIVNPDMPPLSNPYAIGNAWFIDKIIFAENANEELASLKHINPSKEAVIDVRFKQYMPDASALKGSPGDTIRLVSYKPNELIYKSVTTHERLAVLSEIYYPAGWIASIDGKEAPIIRANYILRALVVPPGNHEIILRFRPASYYTGEKISLASSIIYIILVIGYLFFNLLKKRQVDK